MPATMEHPALAAGEPLAIARRFVPAVSCRRLGGERDSNHLVESEDGARYVLKVVADDEAATSIPLQAAALSHLARAAPDLALPRVVPLPDGRPPLALPGGSAWMLTFLDGELLSDVPSTDATLASVARAAGALAQGLAGFEHPALDRPLEWSLDRAGAALADLTYVRDAASRSLAEAALESFVTRHHAVPLPRQAVHGDLNPFNILINAHGEVSGIIDFGDLHRGSRVTELAVAMSYHVDAPEQTLRTILDVAWPEAAPTRAEAEMLPVAIAARLAMTLAITARRAAARPDEARYLLRNVPAAERGLRRLADGGGDRLRALLREKAPA